MKWFAILPVLVAAMTPAQAETMEAAFATNCPKSVMADEVTVRLHCTCMHRQIVETSAFPEDREASFALIGPAETLADMSAHSQTLAKLPPEVQRAIEGRRHTVLQVIMPLCLMAAASGDVLPDGSIKE